MVARGDGEQRRPEAEAASPSARSSSIWVVGAPERMEAEVVDDVPRVPGAGEGDYGRGGLRSSTSGGGVSVVIVVVAAAFASAAASAFALVILVPPPSPAPPPPPLWRPRRLFPLSHCLGGNLEEP